jgi:four helix bundle protein
LHPLGYSLLLGISINTNYKFMNEKIREFTDLVVWKEGHKLVLLVYKTLASFPKEEIFGLSSQMKRASVSITSNIAEGFARRSYKEKLQFYYIAQGSLIELTNQLLISKDLNFISEDKFLEIQEKLQGTHRLLQGLITKSKTIINS